RLLGPALRPPPAARDLAADAAALGVERAAHDAGADTREARDPAPPDEPHREPPVVALLAPGHGGELAPRPEPDARDHPERRVRLLRGVGLRGGAHPATLGASLARGHLVLLGALGAPLAEQLVDGGQNDQLLRASGSEGCSVPVEVSPARGDAPRVA